MASRLVPPPPPPPPLPPPLPPPQGLGPPVGANQDGAETIAPLRGDGLKGGREVATGVAKVARPLKVTTQQTTNASGRKRKAADSGGPAVDNGDNAWQEADADTHEDDDAQDGHTQPQTAAAVRWAGKPVTASFRHLPDDTQRALGVKSTSPSLTEATVTEAAEALRMAASTIPVREEESGMAGKTQPQSPPAKRRLRTSSKIAFVLKEDDVVEPRSAPPSPPLPALPPPQTPPVLSSQDEPAPGGQSSPSDSARLQDEVAHNHSSQKPSLPVTKGIPGRRRSKRELAPETEPKLHERHSTRSSTKLAASRASTSVAPAAAAAASEGPRPRDVAQGGISKRPRTRVNGKFAPTVHVPSERAMAQAPSAKCAKLCEQIRANAVGPVLSLRSVIDSNASAADIRAILVALLENDTVRLFSPGQQATLFTNIELLQLLLQVLRRQTIFGIELGENRFKPKCLEAFIVGLEGDQDESEDPLRHDVEFQNFISNSEMLRGGSGTAATAARWIRGGPSAIHVAAAASDKADGTTGDVETSKHATQNWQPVSTTRPPRRHAAATAMKHKAAHCPATAVAFTFVDAKMGVSEAAIRRIKDATHRRRIYDKARAVYAAYRYNAVLAAQGSTVCDAMRAANEHLKTNSWLHYSNHHWILSNENITRCFWRPYQERAFWMLAGYDVLFISTSTAGKEPRARQKWVNPIVQKLGECYKRCNLSSHETCIAFSERQRMQSTLYLQRQGDGETSRGADINVELSARIRAIDEAHIKRLEKFTAVQLPRWMASLNLLDNVQSNAAKGKAANASAKAAAAAAAASEAAAEVMNLDTVSYHARISPSEFTAAVERVLGPAGNGDPEDYQMNEHEASLVTTRLRYLHSITRLLDGGMSTLIDQAKNSITLGASTSKDASMSVARAIDYLEEFFYQWIHNHIKDIHVFVWDSPEEAGWYPTNVSRILELQQNLLGDRRVAAAEVASKAVCNRQFERAREPRAADTALPTCLGVGRVTYCPIRDVSRWADQEARAKHPPESCACIRTHLRSSIVKNCSIAEAMKRRVGESRCFAVTTVPLPSYPDDLREACTMPWPQSHPDLKNVATKEGAPSSSTAPKTVLYTLQEVVCNMVVNPVFLPGSQ